MPNYYINIDDICEFLGSGFSREKILALYKNEGHFEFVIIDENPENASGLISSIPLYHDKIDNLTDFSNIFAPKKSVEKYIQNNAFHIKEINESHNFSITYDPTSFSSHPFGVVEFQYALQTWFDIYSTPDRNVYACNRNRKKHSMMILHHIEGNYPHLPNTTKNNIRQLINPIPETGTQEISFKPLPPEALINKPHPQQAPLPLSINYNIANQCQFHPTELHMAIEAWVNIFGNVSKTYKPEHKTYKQVVIKWLNFYFPCFKDKVYDRIATLLNIEKRNKTP